MADFSEHELAVLLEAVHLWAAKDSQDYMFSAMLGMMCARSKEGAQASAKAETAKYDSLKSQRDARKDEATLLKAKLINLKRAAVER